MMVLQGRMTDKEWWERYGQYPVERGSVLTYEDMYKMFKKRMMEEMNVQVVGSQGILRSKK